MATSASVEAGKLYTQGKFEPALRIAQIGNPRKEQAALLQSTAGLAALQLGSPDTLAALVERSLKIDNSTEAKLQAAGFARSRPTADDAGAAAGGPGNEAAQRPDAMRSASMRC